MPEFHDPFDPQLLPERRCSKCKGTMKAVEAGSESFQPVARYICQSCGHEVKIVPAASTGSWLAIALVASLLLAGLIYLTSKPFNSSSVLWIGLVMMLFIIPFLPACLRAKRHPVVGNKETPAFEGFLGNLAFLAVLFAAVLVFAALAGMTLD